MAFGGVETGNTKAKLPPNAEEITRIKGSTPKAEEIEIAMGTTIFTAAVLDMNSVRKIENK